MVSDNIRWLPLDLKLWPIGFCQIKLVGSYRISVTRNPTFSCRNLSNPINSHIFQYFPIGFRSDPIGTLRIPLDPTSDWWTWVVKRCFSLEILGKWEQDLLIRRILLLFILFFLIDNDEWRADVSSYSRGWLSRWQEAKRRTTSIFS